MTEEEFKSMGGGQIIYIDDKSESNVTFELDLDLVRKAAEACADEHGLLKKPQVRSKYTDAMVRDIFIEGFMAGVSKLWEEGRKPILKITAEQIEK